MRVTSGGTGHGLSRVGSGANMIALRKRWGCGEEVLRKRFTFDESRGCDLLLVRVVVMVYFRRESRLWVLRTSSKEKKTSVSGTLFGEVGEDILVG